MTRDYKGYQIASLYLDGEYLYDVREYNVSKTMCMSIRTFNFEETAENYIDRINEQDNV